MLQLAREALKAAVRVDPDLADELLLLRNADSGEPAASALMYRDLVPARITHAEAANASALVAPHLGILVGSSVGYLIKRQSLSLPVPAGVRAHTWAIKKCGTAAPCR